MKWIVGGLRNHALACLTWLCANVFGNFHDEDVALPAIVFAPHPDDETLGCGGAIAMKTSRGVPVTVVFFTDGRASHPGLIDGDELAAIRKVEAVNACNALGVPETHLIFLGLEDGSLSSRVEEMSARCVEILEASEARQVFFPCAKESHPDHSAAHRIVLDALRGSQKSLVAYEYAIYLHRNWPWCREVIGRLSAVSGAASACVRFLREFRCWISIADVRNVKLEALAEHKTQMTRFVDNDAWRTLGCVSDGDFLSWFCGDREFYRRSVTGNGIV